MSQAAGWSIQGTSAVLVPSALSTAVQNGTLTVNGSKHVLNAATFKALVLDVVGFVDAVVVLSNSAFALQIPNGQAWKTLMPNVTRILVPVPNGGATDVTPIKIYDASGFLCVDTADGRYELSGVVKANGGGLSLLSLNYQVLVVDYFSDSYSPPVAPGWAFSGYMAILTPDTIATAVQNGSLTLQGDKYVLNAAVFKTLMDAAGALTMNACFAAASEFHLQIPSGQDWLANLPNLQQISVVTQEGFYGIPAKIYDAAGVLRLDIPDINNEPTGVCINNPDLMSLSFQVLVAGYFSPGYSYAPTCFGRGVRIATPEAERAVEELRAGDVIKTQSGKCVRIAAVTCAEMSASAGGFPAAPICVPAGVMGALRDLIISPRHGIWCGGKLVPAGLVPGAVPASIEGDVLHYYHLKLAATDEQGGDVDPEFDLLLAEGVPCESLRGEVAE